MADTSPFGFLSYWFNATGPSGKDQAGSNVIVVNHVGRRLRVTLKDKAGGSKVLERWSASVLPLDGEWHNVMISWDTQAHTILANLDGATLGLTDLNKASTGGGFDITYNNQPKIKIGGDPDLSDFYTGALTELFFRAGIAIDITDANIVGMFVRVVTGIA